MLFRHNYKVMILLNFVKQSYPQGITKGCLVVLNPLVVQDTPPTISKNASKL